MDRREDSPVPQVSRAEIVLVGMGHTHLILAENLAPFQKAGAQVTFIDPTGFWYSGLATGVLSGMYPEQFDHIDAAESITRRGGRCIRANLVRLDRDAKTITLDTGRTIRYDLLSFNIGSRVPMEKIPGASEYAVPVKPIGSLPGIRDRLIEIFRRAQSASAAPPKIAVVGAGLTGCEIAACIHALAANCRTAAHITLVTRADRILSSQTQTASRKLARHLSGRGINILTGRSVTRIESGAVITESGQPIPADCIILAAGLAAPERTRDLELPLADDGSILVNECLHCPADPAVFAVGDCAAFASRPLKKIGVFAVRQAPVLKHNLIASLQGRPLKKFRPQKKYLLILNLGNGTGLALRRPFSVLCPLMMKAKDRIDRRFLNRYNPC